MRIRPAIVAMLSLAGLARAMPAAGQVDAQIKLDTAYSDIAVETSLASCAERAEMAAKAALRLVPARPFSALDPLLFTTVGRGLVQAHTPETDITIVCAGSSFESEIRPITIYVNSLRTGISAPALEFVADCLANGACPPEMAGLPPTIRWSTNATDYRGHDNETFAFVCPPLAGGTMSSIWGTDIYTDDSAICAAAAHTGTITVAGGPVVIRMLPGHRSYTASTRYGVTSRAYGPWLASYQLVPGGPPPEPLGGIPAPSGWFQADLHSLFSSQFYAMPAGACLARVREAARRADPAFQIRDPTLAPEIALQSGNDFVRFQGSGTSFVMRCGAESVRPGEIQVDFHVDSVSAANPEAILGFLDACLRGETCPVEALVISWSSNATDWRGRDGQLFNLICPPLGGASMWRIWGTGVYTDDSAICPAAVHAGIITTDGGAVTIEILPGLLAYEASERNGVASGGWDDWVGSYTFR